MGALLALIPGVGPALAIIPAGGWKIIGMVALIFAGVITIDRRATYAERGKCDAAAARAEAAAIRRDLDVAVAAKARADKDTIELTREKETGDARIKRLEAEVAKRPVDRRCIISPADGVR